jgi:hypothetical protein
MDLEKPKTTQVSLSRRSNDVQCLRFPERITNYPVPNFMSYKILEACREPGCPICRLEQQGVERYLDNQLYENVNSSAWRDQLRASHGFCREHAWLGVNQRLGDALGFSIIYHDIVNNLHNSLNEDSSRRALRRGSVLGQVPESLRHRIERVIAALTPRKRCPACEHRDELTRNLLSALIEDLGTPEMTEALQASEGLCLPHLRLALASVNDSTVYEALLTLHRAKLEGLKDELAEFIRKNDYQVIKEGFGREGNAWLRAIGLIVGKRNE